MRRPTRTSIRRWKANSPACPTKSCEERTIALLHNRLRKQVQAVLNDNAADESLRAELGEVLRETSYDDARTELSEALPDVTDSDLKARLQEAATLPDVPDDLLNVTYILATEPGTKHHGTVKEIARSAEIRGDEGNTVLIKVELDPDELEELRKEEKLRPGATVTAKVYCGRRPLGYVLLHDVFEFIQARFCSGSFRPIEVFRMRLVVLLLGGPRARFLGLVIDSGGFGFDEADKLPARVGRTGGDSGARGRRAGQDSGARRSAGVQRRVAGADRRRDSEIAAGRGRLQTRRGAQAGRRQGRSHVCRGVAGRGQRRVSASRGGQRESPEHGAPGRGAAAALGMPKDGALDRESQQGSGRRRFAGASGRGRIARGRWR